MKLFRNIQLLSWFNVFYCFKLYSVVAILYFSQVAHSYILGASVFSIVQISQAIFEVPTGVISDKLGRRKSIIAGSICNLASVALYAVGHFYWILVLGAIFGGLCQSFFSGNNDALLYESVEESGQKEKYHEILGKISSNLELSGFIAAALGGLLAFKSYQLLMWISIVPQIMALFTSIKIIEPQHLLTEANTVYSHMRDAFAAYKKSWKLRTLSLAQIIQSGIGEASWTFQSAFYRSVLPVWIVGFAMSLNFLISAVSYRLSGKAIKKLKALNLLICQEIYSRTLYIFALIYPTAASPFILAVASVPYGPGEVAKSSLLQNEFTQKQRATMASINSFLGSCFYAVFALFLGFLADKLGPAKSMLVAQIAMLPVLLLYLRIKGNSRKK